MPPKSQIIGDILPPMILEDVRMVLKQVLSPPPKKKGHRHRNDECEKGESPHDS